MNSISTLDMGRAWGHSALFSGESYAPIAKAFQKLSDVGIIVYPPFQFAREMEDFRIGFSETDLWKEVLQILS